MIGMRIVNIDNAEQVNYFEKDGRVTIQFIMISGQVVNNHYTDAEIAKRHIKQISEGMKFNIQIPIE